MPLNATISVAWILATPPGPASQGPRHRRSHGGSPMKARLFAAAATLTALLAALGGTVYGR
jgi:hypothetical protein